MEKKMIRMIIAGLILAAVLIAAIMITGRQSTDPGATVKVFTDKEPSQIRELTVENSTGGYRVFYDEAEDGYVFDDIPPEIIDVEGFFELMNHAAGFGALRTVSEKAEDSEKYGLNDPEAVINVKYSDGSSFSLMVGSKEPVSGNYYGKVLSDEGSDKVYLFAGEDMIYFLIRKESYISYQVTPPLQVSSPLSAIRDITFRGEAFSEPVTITAVSDGDVKTKLEARSFGPATHIVRMKGVYELDQTYGIEILGSVLGIRAKDIKGYSYTEKELKEQGFEDPYMRVDFSLKNGTDYIADHQMRLVKDENGYLANMLGSPVVYLIDPPGFERLEEAKLCLRWFIAPLRTDLKSLKVEFDGEEYVYTSGTDQNGDIYAEVNGRALEKDLFFSFYRLVTSASSEGVYLEDPENKGEPLMTITYEYNIDGKEPDVMRLYKGAVRRVNVDINSVTEFDMRDAFVEAVKAACRNTVSGDKIEEIW